MASLEHASRIRPLVGERVGGDTAVVRENGGIVVACIVDVLGHGAEAHDLALRIEAFLGEHARWNVVDTLADLHQHIRGSRGASVGVAAIDPGSGRVRYGGIGNTVFRRFGSRNQHLVSRDGIVGGSERAPLDQRLELQDGDVMLLYTDGVRSTFDAREYPDILSDEVAAIARNVVYRFGKNHDDAGCIALRYTR